MRSRTVINIGLLLAALVVLIAAFASPRRTAALPITVSFLSYTNAADGGRLAMFALTNHSAVTIRRWGTSFRESQEQPGVFSQFHLGRNVFLGPGQSEVFSVATPTNFGVWRVRLHCSRDGRRLRFSDWMGQSSEGLIHAIVPKSLRGVPVQRVNGDWIEP